MLDWDGFGVPPDGAIYEDKTDGHYDWFVCLTCNGQGTIFGLPLHHSRECMFPPNPALRWRRPEHSSGRCKAGWMPACEKAPASLNKKLGRPA